MDSIVRTLRAAGCVFAEDEARMLAADAGTDQELSVLVARRAGGEPLEYVLGWAEFHGLRVHVEPGVFVPRRRSEFLVDKAVELLVAPAVVVDLCCGSGALGAAVAAAVRGVELHAADADPAAVRCARRNVPTVYQGDLYAALPSSLRGRVSVLLANAPYVPTAAIALLPPEARDHEHRLALDGGVDGLGVLRRVVAGAAEWLAPGGSLLVESSYAQADALAGMAVSAGLHPATHTDEDGTTVVIATRPLSG